jgi:hypothetical protein
MRPGFGARNLYWQVRFHLVPMGILASLVPTSCQAMPVRYQVLGDRLGVGVVLRLACPGLPATPQSDSAISIGLMLIGITVGDFGPMPQNRSPCSYHW